MNKYWFVTFDTKLAKQIDTGNVNLKLSTYRMDPPTLQLDKEEEEFYRFKLNFNTTPELDTLNFSLKVTDSLKSPVTVSDTLLTGNTFYFSTPKKNPSFCFIWIIRKESNEAI